MLGLIYRTCTNECDQLTLLTVYKTLVRPQLEYVSHIWSPYTKEKIMAIERVQRRAIKFILKCDFSITYPECLVRLGLLPLGKGSFRFMLFFSNVFMDILTLTLGRMLVSSPLGIA